MELTKIGLRTSYVILNTKQIIKDTLISFRVQVTTYWYEHVYQYRNDKKTIKLNKIEE